MKIFFFKKKEVSKTLNVYNLCDIAERRNFRKMLDIYFKSGQEKKKECEC